MADGIGERREDWRKESGNPSSRRDEEEEGDSMDGDEDGQMTMDESDCNNGGGNTEKSTVGRLVRFIGEKVWAAWN